MTFETHRAQTVAPSEPDRGVHRLEIQGVTKSYGPTRAVGDMQLEFRSDAVTAVVGGNGAGKSTLMKIIAGEVVPDAGRLVLDGVALEPADFSPARAHANGIRIVHQELSLSGSLTVAENFYVEQSSHRLEFGWRRRFAATAREALEQSFGAQHRIAPTARVDDLNAGRRQMVEIARAATAPGLRVLILDEPTSALGLEYIDHLVALVRSLQERGVIVLFITHKMSELARLTDRIVVMREGRLVADMPTAESTVEGLLGIMLGVESVARIEQDATSRTAASERVLAEVDVPRSEGLAPLTVRAGEIVGLVGLQDAGQEDLLRAVRAGTSSVRRQGTVAYVSGDRRREGIFPLWNSEQNLVVSALARVALRPFRWASARRLAAPWFEKLALPVVAQRRPITALSGGMQQKVLFARGLAGGADLVLLNDPTRGVDLKTKRDMYDLVRSAVDDGAGVLWYSSEDAEVELFDRAYAMSGGRVVAEFAGDEISSTAVMTAAFAAQDHSESGERGEGGRVRRALRVVGRQRFVFALIGLLAVVAILQATQGILTNPFGLGLILSIAPVLALAALAQMFVVAVGDIDLGIGAYMSLVGTIAATSLQTAPVLGLVLLIAVLLIYPALAWLLRVRPFPALVATLAMSFVYSGLALTILPKVGGTVPDWLVAAANLSLPVPSPLIVVVVVAVIGWFVIARSALGTRIRALGSNPAALASSGWNVTVVKISAYALAGIAATLAGLFFAGIATAGDPNAADGYTLLTIACVVIGGCAFLGGRVSAVGVVLAAVLLSLIGVVLGVLQVPSLFTAAATGGLLLVVMALRRVIRTGVDE